MVVALWGKVLVVLAGVIVVVEIVLHIPEGDTPAGIALRLAARRQGTQQGYQKEELFHAAKIQTFSDIKDLLSESLDHGSNMSLIWV